MLHVCNDSFANEEETVQASRHLEGNMQKLAYTCSIWERFNHLFACIDFGGPPLCNSTIIEEREEVYISILNLIHLTETLQSMYR